MPGGGGGEGQANLGRASGFVGQNFTRFWCCLFDRCRSVKAEKQAVLRWLRTGDQPDGISDLTLPLTSCALG